MMMATASDAKSGKICAPRLEPDVQRSYQEFSSLIKKVSGQRYTGFIRRRGPSRDGAAHRREELFVVERLDEEGNRARTKSGILSDRICVSGDNNDACLCGNV